MSESRERLARNQTLFREVNERIETVAGDNKAVEFVCECSSTDCVSTVELHLAEYERIRSNPTWFLIKPDHDVPQIERILFRNEGYALVEKLIAEESMEETDTRSNGTEASRPAGA